MPSGCGRTRTSSRCTSTFERDLPLAASQVAASGGRGGDGDVNPSNNSSALSRRRWLRETAAALALLVAIVLTVFLQRWYEACLEVAEAVVVTDRLDPGWRFEDLEAQRRLPPAERNAAL